MNNPILQWSGIDTLKVGVGVIWPETDHAILMQHFEEAQRQARQDNAEPWRMLAGTFVPTAYGRKKYRFGLQDQSSQFYLTTEAEPDGTTPNVWVELGPRFTTIRDIDQTEGHINATLNEIGGRVQWIKPSELHLTADIQCDEPIEPNDFYDENFKPKWTTRARTTNAIIKEEIQTPENHITKGQRMEYIRIGAGPLQVRIYNKTQELKIRTEKLWEKLLWHNPLAEHVTRVEFQIRREKLKEFDINNLEMMRDLAPIWKYLTTQWFQIQDKPTKARNHQPPNRFWETVISAQPEAEARIPRKRIVPNALARVCQGMGNITTALAQLYASTPEQISEQDAMNKMVHLWKITSEQARPNLWDAVDQRREKLRMQMRAHVINDETGLATAKNE